MTETFRQAAITGDIGINGMDSLFKANDYMDKLIDKMKNLTSITGDSNTKMKGMNEGNNELKDMNHNAQNATNSYRFMNNELNKSRSSVENLKNTVMGQNSEIQQMKQRMDELRQNNLVLQSIRDSFKNNNSAIKENIDNVKKLQGSLGQIHDDNIKRLGQSGEETGRKFDESEKKLHRFRDTALGTFAGNIFANTFGSIPSVLKDATEQGLKFSSAGADVKKNWANAGLNPAQTDGMIKQLGEIQQHANISAGSIVNMQKQYLGLTNGNVGQAQALTNTVTSFGKDSGMGERQNKMLNRMMSSNQKVNAGMFNKTALGPLRNEIIKMSGMTKESFNNMLNAGKITGDKLRGYMISASKDSGKAWNQYLQTDKGKADMFHATMTKTRKLFDTGVSGNLFKSIQQIVGQHKSLAEVQKTVEGLGQSLGQHIGNTIGRVVTFITKNEHALKTIGSSVWNIVKAIGSGAWNTIKSVLNIFGGQSKNASKGLNGVADALNNISKHKTALKTIGTVLVTAFAISKFRTINKGIAGVVGSLGGLTKGGFKTIKFLRSMTSATNSSKYAMRGLTTAFKANPIGWITTGIELAVTAFALLYTHSKKFRGFINGLLSWAKKFYKGFSKWFGQAFRKVAKYVGPFVKKMINQFKVLWKDVTSILKNAWNVIKDILRTIKDVFTLNFKDLGKIVPKLVGDMWKLVKSLFKGAFDWLNTETGGALGKIWDTFKGWGKSIGNFFKNLWDGIKKTTADAINGVTGIINDGIKGLNWILSKLGGSGHTIGEIPKVHFAQGTMDGKLPKNTMAMLNDGNDSPSTQNKELVQLPNGREFIPQKRNWVGFLPKGSRIFNATQTKMLMELRGIKRYGLGSFIGGIGHSIAKTTGNITHGAEHMASSAWNGAKHMAGKAWDWTKGVASKAWSGAKAVGNAIAHPIKFLKSLFGGLPKMPEFFTDFGSGVLNKVKDMAVSFFNKNSAADNPVGGDTKRWIPVIKKAAAFMHQNLAGSDIGALLNRIQKESGGNPSIRQQVQDVNSAAGNPARGLVQYTPTTFAGWSLPGHGNITNGFDQLLAVMNDSNWKSDIRMPGGWGPTGHRARKNGGPVKANDIYRVNEEGFELFKPKQDGKVINHHDSKRIVNNANRPIKINYNPRVNITGSHITREDISKALEDDRDTLIDKLLMELNNGGGLSGI